MGISCGRNSGVNRMFGFLAALGVGAAMSKGGRQKAPDYQPMANAQKEAAEVTAGAMDRQTALLRQRMEQVRSDTKVWRDTGSWAATELVNRLKAGAYDQPEPFNFRSFQAPGARGMRADPGYQYILNESQKAINRQGGAMGQGHSGATLNALQQNAQGLAAQQYDKIYQRRFGEYQHAYGRALDKYRLENASRTQDYNYLAGLSGQGLQATTGMQGMNNQLMGQSVATASQAAQSRAAGIINPQAALIQGQVAQNQARQQNFSNLMGGVGLGSAIFME